MHIEIVGADLPLAEVSRVVKRMAEELGWEAHWDGEKFQVRKGELDEQDGFGSVCSIRGSQGNRGDC
ncbi:MAG: hypothetical protein PHO57_03030 [Acidithiobacillus sp.]|jgi:hypothetical protein|nr:hypothetical protein [Acidithiobacillus sp.]